MLSFFSLKSVGEKEKEPKVQQNGGKYIEWKKYLQSSSKYKSNTSGHCYVHEIEKSL